MDIGRDCGCVRPSNKPFFFYCEGDLKSVSSIKPVMMFYVVLKINCMSQSQYDIIVLPVLELPL